MVTRGYFGNEGATGESFVALPEVEAEGEAGEGEGKLRGEKWFMTGDIAVYRDGKFYIVDRMKELLKYKGLQIAPAELENVIASHPGVAEAAVVGVPGWDVERGEVGSDLPRAYVVRQEGSAVVSEEEVCEWVKGRLAEYKQLRGGVVFLDQIPKNAIGKYLRRELRERAKVEVGGGDRGGLAKL